MKRLLALKKTSKTPKQNALQQSGKSGNGQLMAFGILLEAKYKTLPEHERAKIRAWADSLTKQTQARALEGFARLDSATEKETETNV